MTRSWRDRMTAFEARHPVLMAVATLVLAAACTILLLSSTQGQAVLYQAF